MQTRYILPWMFFCAWKSFEEPLLFVCVSVSCLCHPAPSNNVIMQELKMKNVKILSEKLLLLLNRGGKIQLFPIFISILRQPSVLYFTSFNIFPLLSRRSCVYVQTHPACTACSAQISTGSFCQQRDSWHLLPYWHDGDDRHCRPANIWPITWGQGETPKPLSALMTLFLLYQQLR